MPSQRVEKRAARRQRVRRRVRGSQQRPRLAVYRSLHHIYAQVISDETGTTLVASSTMAPDMRATVKSPRSLEAAKTIGKVIAQKCMEKGISEVVFDRNGFLYHGRVKALAEAARAAGLKF
jgi:large subunit ribosomal protein L18